MTITSTFNPNAYTSSVETILAEWLADFFPAASYTVTFEQPTFSKDATSLEGGSTKPIVWLQNTTTDNRDTRRARRGGNTVQRKDMTFAVSLMGRDRATVIQMAETFERHAVLASASALGAAGLRYATSTPFQDVIVASQPRAYRRAAILSVTVEVVK